MLISASPGDAAGTESLSLSHISTMLLSFYLCVNASFTVAKSLRITLFSPSCSVCLVIAGCKHGETCAGHGDEVLTSSPETAILLWQGGDTCDLSPSSVSWFRDGLISSSGEGGDNLGSQ